MIKIQSNVALFQGMIWKLAAKRRLMVTLSILFLTTNAVFQASQDQQEEKRRRNEVDCLAGIIINDAIGQSLQSLQELFETQQHRLPTDQRLRVSEPFTTEMKNRSGCQIELIRSILAAKKALTDMATLDGCLKQTHADPSCFQELQDRLVVLQRNVVVQESQAVAQASQTKGLADVSLEEIHEQLRDIRIRSQQGLERISQGKVRTQDSLVSEKRAIVHFIPTTTEGMFEMMQDVDASMAKASQKK